MNDDVTQGPIDPATPLPAEPDVANVLERIRSGVRQRQAELATLAGESEASKLRRLELKSLEWVEEPPLFSHRPGLGRLIVFARKAAFHAFVKWYARPILQRQNRFNQVASQLIQELSQEQSRLAHEVARLEGEVARLSHSVAPPEPPEAPAA